MCASKVLAQLESMLKSISSATEIIISVAELIDLNIAHWVHFILAAFAFNWIKVC